jgi:hypothetical protein
MFGCGSSDETNPVPDNTIVEDDTEQNMTQVNVSNEFDWSTSDEFTIRFQLVSSITEINDSNAQLGGKHLLKIKAFDENYYEIDGYLLQGLTDVTGQLTGSMKLQQAWGGIRVHTMIDGVECTRDVLAEDITNFEEVACDIETDSDW